MDIDHITWFTSSVNNSSLPLTDHHSVCCEACRINCCHLELLGERAHINLLSPSTSMLTVKVPINVCYGIWLQCRILFPVSKPVMHRPDEEGSCQAFWISITSLIASTEAQSQDLYSTPNSCNCTPWSLNLAIHDNMCDMNALWLILPCQGLRKCSKYSNKIFTIYPCVCPPEGKHVAVKYQSDDWLNIQPQLDFEQSMFTKTQRIGACAKCRDEETHSMMLKCLDKF